MIPAVAQTLANVLSGDTSSINQGHIDFDPPSLMRGKGAALNIYCYHLRESSYRPLSEAVAVSSGQRRLERDRSSFPPTPSSLDAAKWFDVSFLVSAQDQTALGSQQLLSEALTQLLRYRFLPAQMLAPALRGQGSLPIQISTRQFSEATPLWKSLGVPPRPSFHVTVSVPFPVQDMESDSDIEAVRSTARSLTPSEVVPDG